MIANDYPAIARAMRPVCPQCGGDGWIFTGWTPPAPFVVDCPRCKPLVWDVWAGDCGDD